MSRRRTISPVHLARSAVYLGRDDGSICYGGRYVKPLTTDPDAVTCRACRNSGAWQRAKMRQRDADKAAAKARLVGGEG